MNDGGVGLGISASDRGRMEEVQRLAAAGAASVPALIALLSEPSWVVRRAVVAALARAGSTAVAALCGVLRTQREHEGRLAAAVDALVASGADVETAVLALGAEEVPSPVLCDVAQILGRRKSRAGVNVLAEWSHHTDDNVAVAAIEALGRLGGPVSVDSLLDAVQSGNFFRVFPAISVLGQCGEQRAVTPLATLLAAPQYASEAASALGRTGQAAAVAPLARQLTSTDAAVVQASARALVELRRRQAERVGDSAGVLAALREAAPAGATQRLTAVMNDADPGDRVALAVVRAWLRDLGAVDALVAMLDGEGSIADEALHALRSIGAEAEPHMLRAVAYGTSEQRARLLPLLGARRSAVSELVLCLGDADAAVRALACDALARAGEPARWRRFSGSSATPMHAWCRRRWARCSRWAAPTSRTTRSPPRAATIHAPAARRCGSWRTSATRRPSTRCWRPSPTTTSASATPAPRGWPWSKTHAASPRCSRRQGTRHPRRGPAPAVHWAAPPAPSR
ncbi:MAG: HEAT repeat domain-containing protein [Polyangiaceae bacterium]